MDISFYTAGISAKAHQTKLDVIGNNMANANTYGYKSQSTGFVDLLYSNMREPAGANTQLKVGSGVRVEKTDNNFNGGALVSTDNPTDYGIIDSGFFAVQDTATNQIYYTRDGSFQRSQGAEGDFYLVTASGNFVLDENSERIKLNVSGEEEDTATDEDTDIVTEVVSSKPGVFDFQTTDGMLLMGNNLYASTPENGPVQVKEDAVVVEGSVELSNVEVSVEMVKLIETQKAYSMALRMVQTSNEIEGVIDGLRG